MHVQSRFERWNAHRRFSVDVFQVRTEVKVIRIVLTQDEQIEAHRIGLYRAMSGNQSFNTKQVVSFHENIARDAEAVGAEMAVARYFRIPDFAPTLDGYKRQADIGTNIEVKWTKWKDGHLILSERDRKEDVAVLVTGSSPSYYVVGWIPIAVARRPQAQRSDGSWWINQSDLHPMENFLRSSYGEHSAI